MPDNRQIEAILYFADRPTSAGTVFPAEELRAVADGKTTFFDEERQALVYRGPPFDDAAPWSPP